MAVNIIEWDEEAAVGCPLNGPCKDGREVFETSDLEETESEKSAPALMADSINASDVDYDKSRELFENEILENISSDFSGRTDRFQDAQMTSSSCRETKPQKLARIRRELEEIELLDESSEDGGTDTVPLKKLLDQLDSKAKSEATNIKKLLCGSDETQKLVELPKLNLELGLARRLAALENQVSRLELVLGSSGYSSQKSITTTMDELYRQIKLIRNNDKLLNDFGSKLESISANYEKTLIARKASRDSSLQKQIVTDLISSETKVSELYDSFSVLKRYKDTVPQITTRMKTLNSLHMELGGCVNTVKTVDSSVKWIADQNEKWQKMLLDMDEKLESIEKRSEANKQEVTNWLTHIESQLEEMS
ncbi:LAQU0S05e06458g1_1 [Lachancea quebecensis]|uniref:LAQU0S05e06458g1_1 n=1 Tax=Lachancea quebecensis TaxID=1654605 RepID=A0A0P1KR43_9SACH|nr:LAQU0S05e06458g1_1 [Lachancea quebecensis]